MINVEAHAAHCRVAKHTTNIATIKTAAQQQHQRGAGDACLQGACPHRGLRLGRPSRKDKKTKKWEKSGIDTYVRKCIDLVNRAAEAARGAEERQIKHQQTKRAVRG